MKRLIAFILIFALLSAFSGCTSNPVAGKLIVNGQDITEGNHVMIHPDRNAEIPLVAIFQALANDPAVPQWQRDSYQAFVDDPTVYLDPSDPDFGLETANPQKEWVRIKTETDYIIDTNSISTLLYWGWDIDIEVDYRKNIVYVNSFDSSSYEKHPAKLIVNGKDITEGNTTVIRIYYQDRCEELPLLAIAEELGADVQWQEDFITVRYKGNETTLDLSLDDFGHLPPIGGTYTRKATQTEVYMDWISAEYFFNSLMDVDISVDYENYIVQINS